MFKPANEFTRDILTIFVTRVGVILNKVFQKRVTSYDGEIFSYHISNTFNFITVKNAPENTTFMWSTAGEVFDIRFNCESFENLLIGDNLKNFTTIEQKIMTELIEKEKKMFNVDEIIYNILHPEPLGPEFEKVWIENLDKLYES